MFIELVDVLRCPNRHSDTWLVLAADRMAGRDVMSGTLGCPICRAEFRIVDGIARFGHHSPPDAPSATADENEPLRLAALLDLTDARGYAILVGETGYHAPKLRELTDVQLLLVDPPSGINMGSGISALTTPETGAIPLAAASARAVALDDGATFELLTSVVSILTTTGRLLAPVRLPVPDGLRELARDHRHWLAEAAPIASGLTTLNRRRPA